MKVCENRNNGENGTLSTFNICVVSFKRSISTHVSNNNGRVKIDFLVI